MNKTATQNKIKTKKSFQKEKLAHSWISNLTTSKTIADFEYPQFIATNPVKFDYADDKITITIPQSRLRPISEQLPEVTKHLPPMRLKDLSYKAAGPINLTRANL